jgi:hypothetical protein
MLAGGAPVDIADIHGVSVNSVYTSFWESIVTINQVLELSFDITDNHRMDELEAGFANKSGHVLRGFVGAIDGIAIKIRKPTAAESKNPMSYYNRKGFFAINVQAICDAERRFLWVAATCCGSTHDSTAWTATKLYQELAAGKLEESYHIAADDAYGLTKFTITPYSVSLGYTPIERQARDSFNFYQSRLRINIECAFGELVRRWGILWRKMEFAVERVPLIISACMKLHNLCVEHRLETTESCFGDQRWGINTGPVLAPDGPFGYAQNTCSTEQAPIRPRRNPEPQMKRDALKACVHAAGLRRPATSVNKSVLIY